MKSFMSRSLFFLIGSLLIGSLAGFYSHATQSEDPEKDTAPRVVTQLIINALNECKWSLRSTERPVVYLDQSARIIQSNEKAIAQYKKFRNQALAKDNALVQQNWGEKISECNARLPAQLAKYKQQYHLAVNQETIENMTQAYAFGYSKLFNNMLSALNKIQNGYLTLSDASKALFKVKPDDSQCRFESMIDENAVYVCPGSFVIALKEEKDVNYIQGTQLPAGYYILTGTKNFTTILGGQKQAFIFKQLSPLPKDNHAS
ncbi:hypothetical protein [Vibrio quintilis]|uniref:hypothetical protein n=1 Tax=Vibrio quintilis TaxID=1117707 RepID=UPI0013563A3F|nr:hypothetical protein [Vibrio quintilis]